MNKVQGDSNMRKWEIIFALDLGGEGWLRFNQACMKRFNSDS